MKLKKTDLLDLKVKISCKNDIAYMDCALLLDKPEFLELLPDLRKRYGIKKLLDLSEYHDWIMKKYDETPKKVKKMPSRSIFDTRNILDLDSVALQLDEEAENISRHFQRPSYFSNIIQHAIVCGEVSDMSYRHTKIGIFPEYIIDGDHNPLPEIAITITPMTTLKDVQEVFENNVPQIFEDNKKILKYYYKMKNRKSSNIRRDREWYWRNLKGEGYTKIALSITSPKVREQYKKQRNRYIIPEYEMVKQAIRRYKRYLEVYI